MPAAERFITSIQYAKINGKLDAGMRPESIARRHRVPLKLVHRIRKHAPVPVREIVRKCPTCNHMVVMPCRACTQKMVAMPCNQCGRRLGEDATSDGFCNGHCRSRHLMAQQENADYTPTLVDVWGGRRAAQMMRDWHARGHSPQEIADMALVPLRMVFNALNLVENSLWMYQTGGTQRVDKSNRVLVGEYREEVSGADVSRAPDPFDDFDKRVTSTPLANFV